MNFFFLQFIALVLICVAVYAKVSSKITSLPILGGVVACGVFLLLVAIMGVAGAVRHSQVILFFVSFSWFLLNACDCPFVLCVLVTLLSWDSYRWYMPQLWNMLWQVKSCGKSSSEGGWRNWSVLQFYLALWCLYGLPLQESKGPSRQPWGFFISP